MSRYLRQLAHHAGVAPVTPAAPQTVAAAPEPAAQNDIEEQIVEHEAPTSMPESTAVDRVTASVGQNDVDSDTAIPLAPRAEPRTTAERTSMHTDSGSVVRGVAAGTPSTAPAASRSAATTHPNPPTGAEAPELNAQQVLQRVLAWIGERENAAPTSNLAATTPPPSNPPSPRTADTAAVPARPLAGVVAIGRAREPAPPPRESPEESLRPAAKPVEPAAVAAASIAPPPAKPAAVVAARRAEPPAATPAPEIHVSIGAIELTVEAPPPAPRPTPPPTTPSRPQAAARSDHAPRAVLSTRARRQYLRPFP